MLTGFATAVGLVTAPFATRENVVTPAAWRAAQVNLATLSTNAVHRVISGATHASLLEVRTDTAPAGSATRRRK